jgi:hypothetical protein
LVVACSAAPGDATAAALVPIYLDAVVAARTGPGRYRNRRDPDGGWLDEVGPDDTQGRVWWALGTAAVHGPTDEVRATALELLGEIAMASEHLRPHATTILGVAPVVATGLPVPRVAHALVRSTSLLVARVGRHATWPEPRLTYDNARLPAALLAAGVALEHERTLQLGLDLLGWLVAEQTLGRSCSFVPAEGCVPGGPRPRFDQQPIEAAGLASACSLAWRVTGDATWWRATERVGRWLFGDNDAGVALYDPATGGTYDGLEPTGVNRNRGAESTISGLEVLLAVAAAGSGPSDVVVEVS